MLKQFKQWLVAEGYASLTQKAYLPVAEQFLRSGMTPSEYQAHIVEESNSRNTARQRASALHTFARWAGHIDEQELPSLPKGSSNNPTVARREHVERLVPVLPKLHHRLAVQLMFYTCLRIGEVLSLRAEDVNIDDNTIQIHRKGGDRQVIPFKGLKTLSESLHKRLRGVSDRSEKLVPVTGNAIRQAIKRALENDWCEGIPHLPPHAFRHGGAHWLATRRGANAEMIRKLLGHSSLQTTQKYLTRVGNVEELEEVLQT